MSQGKRVAIFDFDDTLSQGDSFMPFLTRTSGVLPAYAALAESLARYAFLRLTKQTPVSLRTFVKSFLLRKLLKGKKVEDLTTAIAGTLAWRKLNEPVAKTFRKHREKGDVIVIASGSLNLYLPELLKDLPHDALICTDIGIENGVITGDMIHGNCVRLKKAERVEAWLAEHGPFDESFGYGNYPHDVPMLNLVKHRVIVS